MSELSSRPISIQSLYAMYRKDQLYVNRRYQRKLVWTQEEKMRLVESIFNRYPIPAILIAERKTGDGYEIIDGLQRLHAIVSFIETRFPTLGGFYFNVNYFPTAKDKADSGLFFICETDKWIEQEDVSNFLDYNLSLSVMRNVTDDEVNDVFGRINTYGHRLSDQERRQAGVENEFSKMIRRLASDLRGDASQEILLLKDMPSISIDLPMGKHGYEVKASEVVWVEHGILRSTDLRDSMDEQCIADIAACIVGGQLIERSKDALDEIYDSRTSESERVNNSLEVYGVDKFCQEFKFCFDKILEVCRSGREDKLRNIIFKKGATNAFPSIFAILVIAFHELMVKEGMVISNFSAVKDGLAGLYDRIKTSRQATLISERKKNVDTIKGVISSGFIKGDSNPIYGNHTSIDVETILRRSEVEVAEYELKQGMLTLGGKRKKDNKFLDKFLKTLCAIANNGPKSYGKVIVGVTDKVSDAEKIKKLDGVDPKKVGSRYVVGVKREAKALGISVEDYYQTWKELLKNSKLSPDLRDSILSHIDFNEFHGLGVIIFTIPEQKQISYYDGQVYFRSGNSTELAETPEKIVSISKFFL